MFAFRWDEVKFTYLSMALTSCRKTQGVILNDVIHLVMKVNVQGLRDVRLFVLHRECPELFTKLPARHVGVLEKRKARHFSQLRQIIL